MTNKSHLISVVIPTYNRAEFIKSSVDSVLAQKLPTGWQMELIVVDDGSTDNTSKILTKYGDKIKFIPAPHTGLSAAVRNIGIKAAGGELIAFQDDDDAWLPNKLIKQIPVFKDPKVALVHGKIIEMGDEQPKDTSGKLTTTSFESLLASNVVATMTVVVRAEVLKELEGFSEDPILRGIEDYYLWLMVGSKKANVIKYLDSTLGEHRTHLNSLSYEGGFKELEAEGAEYQVKALKRIVTAIEQVLFDERVTEQIDLIEDALVSYAEMIFTLRNPIYARSAPKISVVLPMYNSSAFIEKALKSILGQTFTDFEVIAIDDGSKDNTAQVVRAIDDPRVKVIRQHNRGLLRTNNKGISISRGMFIARQDGDDISMPSRFEKQIMYLASHKNVGMVSCYYTHMDELNEGLGFTQAFPFKPIDVKQALYFVNPITHGGVLARKEVFEKIGLYPTSHEPIEDYKAWCDMADVAEIAIIPESLYWYRINPGGISITNYDKSIEFPKKIAEEQWHKPVAYKSYHDIVKDGKYYRSLESPFAKDIYEVYLSHQRRLAKQLWRRGHPRSAFVTSLGVFRLQLMIRTRLQRLNHRIRRLTYLAIRIVKYVLRGGRRRK